MYEEILLPTDGSEGTHAALDHAIDLARTYDAGLHTLYVVDTSVTESVGTVGVLDALEDAGQRALDRVIDQASAAGVERVEGSVATGVPYRAILEYAEDHGIDLIVMGTHGRTGVDRYLLGSVTEKVVRMSEIPVLSVRMDGEASAHDFASEQ